MEHQSAEAEAAPAKWLWDAWTQMVMEATDFIC